MILAIHIGSCSYVWNSDSRTEEETNLPKNEFPRMLITINKES